VISPHHVEVPKNCHGGTLQNFTPNKILHAISAMCIGTYNWS